MRSRACIALLAGLVLAPGCGGAPARTVTVERASPPPAGPSELSRADSDRVAEARLALDRYCTAVRAGEHPDDADEVAALTTLITIFVRHPFARFGPRGAGLDFSDALKDEADGLDDGCDHKAAKLLRQTVDVTLYVSRR